MFPVTTAPTGEVGKLSKAAEGEAEGPAEKAAGDEGATRDRETLLLSPRLSPPVLPSLLPAVSSGRCQTEIPLRKTPGTLPLAWVKQGACLKCQRAVGPCGKRPGFPGSPAPKGRGFRNCSRKARPPEGTGSRAPEEARPRRTSQRFSEGCGCGQGQDTWGLASKGPTGVAGVLLPRSEAPSSLNHASAPIKMGSVVPAGVHLPYTLGTCRALSAAHCLLPTLLLVAPRVLSPPG